jgi:hypothetical protein
MAMVQARTTGSWVSTKRNSAVAGKRRELAGTEASASSLMARKNFGRSHGTLNIKQRSAEYV